MLCSFPPLGICPWIYKSSTVRAEKAEEKSRGNIMRWTSARGRMMDGGGQAGEREHLPAAPRPASYAKTPWHQITSSDWGTQPHTDTGRARAHTHAHTGTHRHTHTRLEVKDSLWYSDSSASCCLIYTHWPHNWEQQDNLMRSSTSAASNTTTPPPPHPPFFLCSGQSNSEESWFS